MPEVDYTNGSEELYDTVAAGRQRFADLVEGLSSEQYQGPTLCAGWTPHEVASHLLQPMLVGLGRFALVAVRYRGDVDRTVDHVTRRIARRTRAKVAALLREHAADRVSPPRVGPWGQLAEVCLHLRDVARPLGLTGRHADAPEADWELLLGYLTSPTVAPALVPPGRLHGVRLVSTSGRSWGAGEHEIHGYPEALAMAVTGRRVALRELSGPGTTLLTDRLGPPTKSR